VGKAGAAAGAGASAGSAPSYFLASPAQVLFPDFVVGGVYRVTLVLTNVSISFNSYRLLPLPGMCWVGCCCVELSIELLQRMHCVVGR
jgi:hypothetical protein